MARICWCALGLVLAGINVRAQNCGSEPRVRVHLVNIMTVPAPALARARDVAAGLFSAIGVRLEWKEGEARLLYKTGTCTRLANEILEVQFDEVAAARFPRDALAYTVLGQDGITVHIFCNRVATAHSRDLTPVLLGYVLAHEITHALEGVARHSEGGLMKAHWTSEDYNRMSQQHLRFAQEDAQLVRAHIDAASHCRESLDWASNFSSASKRPDARTLPPTCDHGAEKRETSMSAIPRACVNRR
jgi:hypothetical protein